MVNFNISICKGLKLLGYIVLFAICASSVSAQDTLGVPCKDKGWYARNPWAMIVYHQHLYVGCGNSSNYSPDSNAGPVPIWVYHAGIGWVNEYTVDEEQIDRFVLLDGNLAIPGHDSRKSWAYGEWYIREGLMWKEHRNIKGGVHIYDLIDYGGQRFAAIGSDHGLSLAISKNKGKSWRVQAAPTGPSDLSERCPPLFLTTAARGYGFFTFGGDLFLSTSPIQGYSCQNNKWSRAFNESPILRWDGTNFVLSNIDFFGKITADRIVRPHVYESQTIYIAAQTVNDHQWKPIALMGMGTDQKPHSIQLNNCTRPQDIDIFLSKLYVLCNQKLGTTWRISVLATCDLQAWTEVTTFKTLTFARSFALDDRTVYVGLGGDTDAPIGARASMGQILLQHIPSSKQTCSA